MSRTLYIITCAVGEKDSFDELRGCTDPASSELRLTVHEEATHVENDAWSRTHDSLHHTDGDHRRRLALLPG